MNSQFQFRFEKRRALWKDLLYFLGITLLVWGAIHIFLNFDAYAQITQFRIGELKASVFDTKDSQNSQPLVFANTESPRQTLSFHPATATNPAKEVFDNMTVYPSDNRIFIPRIQKNVPLVTVPNHKHWDQLEKNIQSGLRNGVVVHPVSHMPGELGNFFVTGHSSYYKWDNGRFKDIFALLHEVNVGDIVEIYWEGHKYTYQIKAKEVVPPTTTEVLDQPENISIITLMTCTPVGTNKNRLILLGELING